MNLIRPVPWCGMFPLMLDLILPRFLCCFLLDSKNVFVRGGGVLLRPNVQAVSSCFFFPPPPPSLTSSPLSVPQVVKLNGPFRGYHGWPLSVCINVKLADFKARGVLANHSQVFVYLRRNLGVVSDCLHQSLLSISHKIFYKNLFPRLAPYIYDIIRYYLCGFRRDRSTVDHIFFCICETLGKTRGAMVECVSYLYGFKESL